MRCLYFVILLFIFNLSFAQQSDLISIKENGKWGCRDKQTDSLVIPFIYTYPLAFKNGYSVAVLNEKSGVISTRNEAMIPFQYNWIQDFFNDGTYFRVYKDQKQGIILLNGTIAIPIEYDMIGHSKKYPKKIVAKKNNKHGLLDLEGNVLLPFEYDHFLLGKTEYIVGKEGEFGVIYPNGEILIPFDYERIEILNTTEVLYRVWDNDKCGILDETGTVLLPANYDQINQHPWGGYELIKDGNYGIATDEFKLVVPVEYAYVDVVELLNMQLEITNYGELIVWEPSYYLAGNDSLKHIYNSEGDLLFTFRGNRGLKMLSFRETNEKRFIFKNSREEVGVLDETGQLVLPAAYEEISEINDRFLLLKKEGKYGVANLKGGMILEPVYDKPSAISNALQKLQIRSDQ